MKKAHGPSDADCPPKRGRGKDRPVLRISICWQIVTKKHLPPFDIPFKVPGVERWMEAAVGAMRLFLKVPVSEGDRRAVPAHFDNPMHTTR